MKTVYLMRAKASAYTRPLNLTMFASISDDLQETGMELVCHVLRASLALATFAEKDLLVRKFFNTLFRSERISAALVNGD